MLNAAATFPIDILPWQHQQWRQVWDAKQKDRLAHALLFVGMDGLGKTKFAEALAKAVLCQKPSETGVYCGECHSCHMMNAKSHPDFMLIEPEEEGKKIAVDQIRDIIKNVNETTLKGGFRVIIINPAPAMNVNAANALLKTLEEPTPNTLLILMSNQSLRLPATIMSRCQKIIFQQPHESESLQWLTEKAPNQENLALLLRLANGAPLKALALVEEDLISVRQSLYQAWYDLSQNKADPLQVATQWQNANHLMMVDLLLSWLVDVLRFKLTCDVDTIVNTDQQKNIVAVSQKLSHDNVLSFVDHLQQVRIDLLSSINLNKQLMLENLFIRWVNYVSR